MLKPDTQVIRFIQVLTLIGLLLSSCTGSPVPGGISGSGLQTWIDQPRSGYTIPQAPISLIASAGAGTTRIQILVNGTTAGEGNTNPAQGLSQVSVDWNPPAPGIYNLQSVAYSQDGQSARSEISHVCVSAADGLAPAGCAEQGQATSEPAPAATDIPTAAATQSNPGSAIQFKLGTDIQTAYYGKCDQQPTVIHFEAAASDTSAAIETTLVVVLQTSSGARQDAGMFGMQPSGEGYTYTLDATTLNTSALGEAGGKLIYKVNLMDQNKQFYASSQENALALLPCQYSQATQVLSPTPFPTVQPILTTAAPPPLIPTYTPTLPAITATFTASPQPPKKPTGYASASQVYYTNGCGENSLTVYAQVSGPGNVKQMLVHWRYTGGSKNPGTEKIFSMSPTGKGTYSLMIMDPTNFVAYPNLNGGNGQIQYWFEVTYGSGLHLTSDPGYVSVSYCPG